MTIAGRIKKLEQFAGTSSLKGDNLFPEWIDKATDEELRHIAAERAAILARIDPAESGIDPAEWAERIWALKSIATEIDTPIYEFD
jgi:hypothetical protein